MKKGEKKMKKNIEWLKKEIATEMIELEPNRKERWSDVKYQTLRSVAQKLDQLDEPEALSKEWVNNNVVHVRGLGDIFEAETVENLLVPKQEELETKILELIESYKQEEDAYSNPENGWISGFIEDLKNLVEEEQKYYVLTSSNKILLIKDNGEVRETYQVYSWVKKRDKEHYQLTEQEIKAIDERYWPFAVKVEELEE